MRNEPSSAHATASKGTPRFAQTAGAYASTWVTTRSIPRWACARYAWEQSTSRRTALDWQPVRVYVDLFRYRDLFLNLFHRELRSKYRGSALGLVWTLINPIVLMLAYWLTFSVIVRAVTVEHYPLFLLTGLLVWVFFQSAIQMSCPSLLLQASLVKQVRLPRQLLPVTVVATNLVTMLVMLAVVLPLNLLIVPETRSTFWAALPLFIPLAALVTGFAIVLASVTVMFRDVEHLIGSVLLPWFILTPIFFPWDQMPGINEHPTLADVLYYGNVVAPIVTAIRDPLFFGELPQLGDVVYAFGVAIGMLVFAAFVFRRIDDQLAAQL
jgi:lipopolysaccharide transport system permease protein